MWQYLLRLLGYDVTIHEKLDLLIAHQTDQSAVLAAITEVLGNDGGNDDATFRALRDQLKASGDALKAAVAANQPK